ncbi:MAG: translocation/assembly module TamB domain-containing protein, partial [Bryobacteraceae bacterium]
SVRLSGDYQGEAKLQFAEMTFDTLRDLTHVGPAPSSPLPFAGSVEGSATLAGPLIKPEELHGELTISKVEMRARPEHHLRFGGQAKDLVLKNAEPVVLQLTARRVHIVSARFTAKDTNLEAAGNLAFDSKSPWNLRVRGGINLTVLQILDPDLIGQGNAAVNATIRGSLSAPEIAGRMQLQNASLYLSDLTNGIDNANGVISFDQDRATIDSLSAELGGGKISLAGFVGFGGAGAPLVYRLQGGADRIRIRYPEGVSVTVTAALNLTGTSESSIMSGSVTVVRASFNPRTDIGALLAQSTQPAPAPITPNEYLRGMQLDVRIENGPGLELQTSLARNIQAELDLRLRGTPARPVLLGEVSVNEGEIELFGNKYEINRGEIRFLNPVKIEPSFDMDLETKARGIDVNISFSGTLSRLNVTYRSDPPLQSSEIIALLAVGRDPNASPGLAQSQVAAQSSFLQSGANTLLGAALSSQVSGRLQRLFGVSRVKIDPQLTGVDNIPQARLTLEQQVSKNITVTYITNLTRTDEQIVQIQWDLNKRWSAVAIRDENGVFGIDFQYRKRFK